MNTYRYSRATMIVNMYLMLRENARSEFSVSSDRFDHLNSSLSFRRLVFTDALERNLMVRTLRRNDDGEQVDGYEFTPRGVQLVERYLLADSLDFWDVSSDEWHDLTGPDVNDVGNRIDLNMFESYLGFES